MHRRPLKAEAKSKLCLNLALHSIDVRKVVQESIEFYYSLISQDSMLCMLEYQQKV